MYTVAASRPVPSRPVWAGLGPVAAVLRHPHEVDAERVALRTGFLGQVTLP